MQLVDRQFDYPDGGGDDVDNGICGADFMKVNLLDGHSMDFCFRLGESRENVDAQRFNVGA